MYTIVVRLVENSDLDQTYGSLVIKSDLELSVKEVSDEIAKAKTELADTDWEISDLLIRLPMDWEVNYYNDNVVAI